MLDVDLERLMAEVVGVVGVPARVVMGDDVAHRVRGGDVPVAPVDGGAPVLAGGAFGARWSLRAGRALRPFGGGREVLVDFGLVGVAVGGGVRLDVGRQRVRLGRPDADADPERPVAGPRLLEGDGLAVVAAAGESDVVGRHQASRARGMVMPSRTSSTGPPCSVRQAGVIENRRLLRL